MRDGDRNPDTLASWMQLAIAALVAYRLIYHSTYLLDSPFSLATFSDGRQYELAALDILAAPPLGTQPFYLQGAYAYFMALPMAIRPWVSLALLLQLIVAGLTVWAFFRCVGHWFGRRQAGWATLVFLAYPGLAFYENKFLTAQLAVTSFVLVLLTLARVRARPRMARLMALGAAIGFAVLMRPNALVVIPFVAWAVVLIARAADLPRTKALASLFLGLALTLAPLSLRNHIVTDSFTILPAHGGGTSFYIGNNRHARGVWNPAGGLLSGDIDRERSELAARLGIEESSPMREAAAIGRALYRRAAVEIADDPGRWAWLMVRKLWLMLGNDELTQDYDWYGEKDMLPWVHRIPVPFGVVLALGSIGALVLRRRLEAASPSARRACAQHDLRPLAWTLAGLVFVVLMGNLVYFTSSHSRTLRCGSGAWFDRRPGLATQVQSGITERPPGLRPA